MRKLITTITIQSTFVLASLILLPLNLRALTLYPASGNLAPNQDTQIALVAGAPETSVSNVTGLQVRLEVSGAEVVGYTEPTGADWESPYGVLADCDGGTTFTSNELCFSMVKGSALTQGESLGIFTLRTGSSGTVTITKGAENGYVDPETTTIVTNTGTAATYNISSINSLPNTQIDNYELFFISVGLLFIVVGLLMYTFRSAQSDHLASQ